MPGDKKMISSVELGKIIGKSDRTIQMLAKTKVISSVKNKNRNEYNLYSVVQEYIDYIAKRETREASSLEDEKVREEIRYKRAKADMMELELKELDGQMHRSEDVEDMTTDLVLAVRSALLSLPGRLGVDVAAVTSPSECSEIIKKAVCEMLEDLSRYEYNAEAYHEKVRERQGWKEQFTDESE